MEETADLALKIDPAAALTAKSSFDEFVQAGRRAEAAAKRVSQSWIENVLQTVAAVDLLTTRLSSVSDIQSSGTAITEKFIANLEYKSSNKTPSPISSIKTNFSTDTGAVDVVANASSVKLKDLAEASAASAEKEAAALRTKVEMYGKSEAAIAKLVAIKAQEELVNARSKLEVVNFFPTRAEEIKLVQQEVAALEKRALAADQAAASAKTLESLAASDKASKVFKEDTEKLATSLTDALLSSFENGKGFAKKFLDGLKSSFSSLVLKPAIQPIMQGIAGVATGLFSNVASASGVGTGAAGSGGSSWLDLTNISGFGNSPSAMVNNFAWSNIGSDGVMGDVSRLIFENSKVISTVVDSAGAVMAYGSAVISAFEGKFGNAIGTAVGYYFGGPIGGFIGNKIGSMIDAAVAGEKRSGGTYALNKAGTAQFVHGPSGGEGGAGAAVKTAINSTVSTINATLKAVGSAATLVGFQAAFEQSEKGRGGVMSGGTLSTGATFGENGIGSNYAGTYYERSSTQSPDIKTAVANFSTDLKQATIQALQAASDIPRSIRSLVNGVDAEALTDEAVSALLTSINDQIAGVEKFRATVNALPFKNLRDLSYDAAASLIKFAGGFDAFSKNLSSYYEVYYSESERMQDSVASMTTVAKALGFTLPETKSEFRALVESLDVTTEAGRLTYTAMMNMAPAFSAWADYARELDTAFGNLAAKFPELTALGQKARGGLVEYSGGLDALQTNLSSYYQSYHSEAERMGDTLASVTATFAGLGLAVPTTREEFRALVESLDLTTGAGQKTYATLMGVGQSFGSVADHITAIVTAARDTAENAATDAMSALTRSVNTQKDALTKAWQDQQEALQKGIDTASTAVTNLKSLSDQVKSTLNTMFGQTDAAMQRSQAQAQIVGALDKARAGGGLPERADLEAAFGIVAQPSADLFATFEDYQLDFLKTANNIAALGVLTDSQLSIEERTLAALKDQFDLAKDEYKRQIDYYDAMLKSAQAQLDAALGNTQATLTVAQALTALSASLASLGASKPPASTGGAPAALSANEQAIWNAYNSSGIGYLDAGGWSFWNDAVKNGASLTDITQQIIDINNGKNNAAINGSHALGLDYVPFDGYIAELHQGERIQTAAEARAADGMYSASMLGQVAAGNGSAELLAEVRALRQEVQGLRSEAQATAQHTAKTAKLATRWDVDGMPETREVATA